MQLSGIDTSIGYLNFKWLRLGFYAVSLIFVAACVDSDVLVEDTLSAPEISDAQQSDSLQATSTFEVNDQYAAVSSTGFGAVASVNPLATSAGLAALEAGGNAIDAAVATALTLGVVDSHNSGIGGGAFILVRLASGEVYALDAREMAPQAAHQDMYKVDGVVQRQKSKTGALAIGIPGSLLGYESMVNRWGKRPFANAFEHGIKHAGNGFSIDKVLAARIERTAKKISQFEASAKIFLSKDGATPKPGQKIIQTDLAQTYSNIARDGADYFYKGEFAQKVDQWMKQNAGIATAEDFKQYTLQERKPVASTFKNYTVYGFPPPSSGGTHVAQILNVLENFELEKMNDADRYHVIAEAMKLAFADRAYWLGDPDFAKVPKGLASQSYADTLAQKIQLKLANNVKEHSTPADHQTNFYEQLNKHTTHIAAADKDGNWVAITATLNTSFGSGVMVPGTGVLLNNQMDDFAADVGVANAFGLLGAQANSIQPGKRPLSSMSPTIVEVDGKPLLTVGAAGGPTIISQVVQVILRRVIQDYSLSDAVKAPRIHHQWQPDRLVVERNIPEAIQVNLKQRGHTVKVWGTFGATQAIELKGETFVPVSEPRIQ